MGQAFSTANVSFCRTDIPASVLSILGGWDYDRICNAWASLIASDQAHTTPAGTPHAFLADLARLQRVTGLSKSEAEQIGQLFSIRSTPTPSAALTASRKRTEIHRQTTTEATAEAAGSAIYPLLEILVVTVVLGNLQRLTKLVLIFSLFDVKGEGRLTEAQFLLMCYFVFRGLAKAVKRPIPGYSSIEPLVLSTFDDLQDLQCGKGHSAVGSREGGHENRNTCAVAAVQARLVNDGSCPGYVPQRTNSGSVRPFGSRRMSHGEAEKTAALVEKLFVESERKQMPQLCCRREMTIGEFIKLTLKPGSAIDMVFKGLQSECALSVASYLAFRQSHQFQTRLFQNVFLVHQWLQDRAAQPTSNRHIRLTNLVSVCLDLAEKSADIVREVYNVIATDRRMALQGVVHLEVPPLCETGSTESQMGQARRMSSADLVAGDGDDDAASEADAADMSRKDRSKIPAYILTDLLVDHHMRRQLKYWWPDLRIQSASDGFPQKNQVFRKLMDVFSSRLFGNPVYGAARLKCRITYVEELKIQSVIQGGQEPWIEISATQGYDCGRGPPVRVMGEAKMQPVAICGDGGFMKLNEELDIELPDVRDNYYIILAVKCKVSDSDVVTVGHGSALLCDVASTKGWIDTTFHLSPSNSPPIYFTSERPRVACSFLLELARPPASGGVCVECSPSRLNGLDLIVGDVVHVDECTVSLHLENGHHSFSTSDANDMSSVAVSVGIAYRGKPVAGIAYFPFSEPLCMVSFTEYGVLSPAFWKDPTVSRIEVPARPPRQTKDRRQSVERRRDSSSMRLNISGGEWGSQQRTDSKDSVAAKALQFLAGDRRSTAPPSRARSTGNSLNPHPLPQTSTRRRNTSETSSPSQSGRSPPTRPSSFGKILTQSRCVIPTGHVPISLRYLDANECFLQPEEKHTRERPIILCSGKGGIGRIKPLLRDLGNGSALEIAAGMPLKVARLVRGEGDIAVEFNAARLWALCGSDAILRSVGGCLVDESGAELLYDNTLLKVSRTDVFAAVDRKIIKATFCGGGPAKT
ncbi:hypothetical protein BESB_008410 [Besnoitia besnoiti]|uniref:3'(2'),5'-bisphosphate nucleotidase n=1 Tax=Besnoitia besnoiti TaxID=94643 RepID=A0A2A9MKN2_BESBE|nr:hypothetical protein BESB_008410 [Besnoitia besnoiti]PFH38499.1 hypothetical protein BESB_008410 [Besnoitia besnoiti]